MSVPTIISMLITTFYSMADTYFVGLLNNNSITGAVGVAYPLMSFLDALGFFFAHGGGTFISRQLGAGEREEAGIMAAISFFSALFIGLVFFLAGQLWLMPLTELLGATETIAPYAREYLSVLLIGAPFVCTDRVLSTQLRFQGSTTISMLGTVSGALINCLLDPLFILVLDMGVKGAAYATVLGQIISFMILYCGTFCAGNIRISLRWLRPGLYYFRAIANGGLPSLFRMGVSSVSGVALNLVAGGFGDYAVAALSICSRIFSFFNSSMMGFGQGFQPICGMNYGAKRYGRVLRGFWFCVKTAFGFLLTISAAGIVFSPQILRLFSHDDVVITFGVRTFRLMCLALPLNAWSVMANMTLQTIGKSARATILACSRSGYSYVPLIFLLPVFLGDTGLQYVHFGADILTALMAVPLMVPVLREMERASALKGD